MLDGVLGGPAFSLPTVIYIALSTAAFSDSASGSSMTEVSGGSYARVAVTNNSTNWPAAVSGSKSNATVFTFPTATSSWGTVTSFYLVDAATGGNTLYGGDLVTPRSISTGDTPSFAIASITISES